MEHSSVKSEVSPTSHGLLIVDGESNASKSVKRTEKRFKFKYGSIKTMDSNVNNHKSSSYRVTNQRPPPRDSLVLSGAYNNEEAAARAYDLVAVKYWGTSTFTNFPVSIEHRGINAVTSFDLRTYIRSLRPSAHSTTSQEQKPSIDTQPFTTPNLIQTRETTKVSNFNFHPFPGGELDNNKKQESSQYMSLSPGNKSASSTALGLLLKPSVFKEVVQRNLNFVNEEIVLKNTQKGTDGVEGIFNNGSTSTFYICSSISNNLPNLESPEESTLPLYHSSLQFPMAHGTVL
ncbi:DNA-binding domain superfamily [Sesbania bispinosa]|nr:DNA-binding domain superfamily [Sesbania bispinosa]